MAPQPPARTKLANPSPPPPTTAPEASQEEEQTVDASASDADSTTSSLDYDLTEGIPHPTEPFLQKYFAGRTALIAQEAKQRHDAQFKATMSPLAKEAARILSSIRKREIRDIWTPENALSSVEGGHAEVEVEGGSVPGKPGILGTSDAGPGGLFHGMMFPLAKERMETTEVWRCLERMPKGALLHAHFQAMLDVEWLVDQALGERGMCVVGLEGGMDHEVKRLNAPFVFRFVGEEKMKEVKGGLSTKGQGDIWSREYLAGTPVSVYDARREFPLHDTTFKKWVVSRCTIQGDEATWHHHGLNAVWRKFLSCFPVLGSILFYEPIFRRAMQKMLTNLAADGVTYMDLRSTFKDSFYLQGKSEPEKGYMKFFEVFGDEIQKFKATEAGKNFQGTRMIWTIIRALGNRDSAENMKECIAIKKKYPELICGFDCVGQEDGGRTLEDLTPLLFWFRKKCHEAGVEIPFFFHAGECLGDGDSTDNNLFDAILLGTRRIGHGYSLYKHPLLIDMVKERKILVESCPISNEILRLSGSIMGHSMPALLARGVAVSLNNDDPSIFGIGKNGLTHDFWQTFMGFENVGLEGIAVMAENSVKWCAVEDQRQAEWIKGINDSYMGRTIRAKMLRAWRSDFEKWCQWIIMEYPLEVDDEDDDEDVEDDEDDDEREDEESD